MPVRELNGLEVLELRGSPESMGEEHGRLMAGRIREFSDSYLKRCESHLGTPYEHVYKAAQVCEPHIPEEYRAEMLATARAAGVDYGEILAMNCVVDIDAHAMEGAYHCCNFVVSPPATRDGLIVHGRNLDFPHHGVLQKFAIAKVRLPEDDAGYATLDIGWVGVTGILTGLNSSQISIGEVGVPARDSRLDGIPIGFGIRRMLERADTVDACFDEIRGIDRTCGFNLAVCDGKTGECCGIETTSRLCERRRAVRGSLVVDDACMCTRTGKDRLSHSAGAFRHARMVQLIKDHYGEIDIETALSFLGDRYDMARGFSHGRSYNCICNQDTVHSVLFAPTEQKVYVAHGETPAPSGGYAPIDVGALWGRCGERAEAV